MEKEKKIWFVKFDDRQEGPFSLLQLKRDHRITPETLVWREGFSKWVPIGKVAELKEVFADEEKEPQKEEKISSPPSVQDELVLDMRLDPYSFLWITLLLVLLTYFFIQWFS